PRYFPSFPTRRSSDLQLGSPSASAYIRWPMSLNPAQARAVTAPPSPLLIIAGAGTGKTNTLAHRVAHLITSGVDPRRILLLTFRSEEHTSELQSRGHL